MTKNILLTEIMENDMEWYELAAMVFAGIGAVAAAIGLIFNGLAQQKQSQSNYARVFKELEGELNAIDSRALALKDYVVLDDVELKKKPDDIKNKTTQFKRDYAEFHDKLAYLYYNKIIPKSIPEFFDVTFAHSLFYIDTSSKKEELRKQLANLVKWCDEKNIKKKQP